MVDTSLQIFKLLLYLIGFGSSITFAYFLYPIEHILARCLAMVMLAIAVNNSLMAFIATEILLKGTMHYTWKELGLFFGALLYAVVVTRALYIFRRVNGR